jgi:hypothetical protein
MTDFTRFEKAARHWLGRLGLTDWHVEIVAPKSGDDGRTAAISFNETNRKARISWYGTPKDRGRDALATTIPPETHALHEVLHLLFADMTSMAGKRGESHEDSIREEHKVIERLLAVMK